MKAFRNVVTVILAMTATFLVWALTAVPQPSKLEESPRAAAAALSKADDEGIRKTIVEYEDAWNAHDMEAIANVFQEDAEAVNVVGMYWRGRDDVVAAHAAFHETMFKDNHLTTDSIESRPLGSDYAISVVTMTQDSYTTPSGNHLPKGQVRPTIVLARNADGWKIVHFSNVRVNAGSAKSDPINGGPN